MRTLAMVVLIAAAAFAQSIDLGDLRYGTQAVIERNGEDREHRIIVGLPHDKQLAQDADFALRWRSQSGGWRFTSISEGLRFWISETTPMLDPSPQSRADVIEAGYDVLLEMTLASYNAAPTLGDSLYFLHADPRTKLVDGVQLIQEDSREWGPVHAREFLRIVDPEPDE